MGQADWRYADGRDVFRMVWDKEVPYLSFKALEREEGLVMCGFTVMCGSELILGALLTPMLLGAQRR